MSRIVDTLILCMRDGQGVHIKQDTPVLDAAGKEVAFGHIPIAVRKRETLWLFLEADTISIGSDEDEDELYDCMTDVRVEDIVRIHRVFSRPAIEAWHPEDLAA